MNEKQQAIFDSALKLFVQYGFHGTPTSKIAAEAGVSNGTLFHYFATKELLITELYIKVKNDLSGYLIINMDPQASIAEIIKQAFKDTIYWALQNRQQFYYIQQVLYSPHIAKVADEIINEQAKLHLDLIEAAKAQGVIINLPTELIASISNSHLFGIYNYATTLPVNEQAQAIESGFSLFWDMLRMDKK